MSDMKRSSSGVQSNPLLVSALPIISYCSASILMTLINKFVVSGKHFSMNFLIVAIQSATSAGSVIIMKRLGIINFRDFDMADAKRWFPVSFLLATVIYTGSKALQYLTINVFSIFKNMTIILIAYGEVFWFGGKVTPLTFTSFILMVLSSVIAAWADISSTIGAFNSAWATGDPSLLKGDPTNHSGYVWMAANCFAQAGFALMMRKKIKSAGFKDWDTTFYNNLLAVPVLTIFSIIAEDWSAKSLQANFPEENRNFLLSTIVFSGCAAIFISYSTAWCVRVTSSTTYSMVGALNKLPVAASGMIFFGEAVTSGSVSALFIGFVAGLVYAIAKNNQKAQETTNPPDALPMHRRA